MSCLILFKSITYAQNGNLRLNKNGVNSYLIRKPAAITGASCGYGLKVNCTDIERAKIILSKNAVTYMSVWRCKGNNWYEI